MFKNPIRWKKAGLLIKPQPDKWWAVTHGMTPTPDDLGGGVFRIYYSGRNQQNQSHISWADVDLNEPFKVLRYCDAPTLTPGDLGCFDDNGVTPCSVVNLSSGEKALYYIGWNPGSTVRVHLFGGLALSTDGGQTFNRYSRAPIIERCSVDPFLNTAPWVVKHSNEYRMYYVSGCGWVHKDLPRYNIKLARSSDGKVWHRDGHVCIDFKDENENALAKPCVIFEDQVWKMWFSYKGDAAKGDAYRLGYAESLDGVDWVRRDDLAGINVSASGFDSEMVAFASVVNYRGRHFMFYNGNTYGYDGIGLAVES